jgi:hypothetical protein
MTKQRFCQSLLYTPRCEDASRARVRNGRLRRIMQVAASPRDAP